MKYKILHGLLATNANNFNDYHFKEDIFIIHYDNSLQSPDF